MTDLIQTDLNQIPFEAGSFLGRALALGQQFKRLPEYLGEALMAYLRAQALAFAHRYRTGIAIGRERLERGAKQAFICVDLGLEEAAGGDLNVAVDLLANSDFEPLRRRGWELALARLAHMRAQARAWSTFPEHSFLHDDRQHLVLWSRIVPEAWTSQHSDGRETWIDPRQDYLVFQELESQMCPLPGTLGDPLQAAREEGV